MGTRSLTIIAQRLAAAATLEVILFLSSKYYKKRE
jgi:hypothetical protein